MDWAGLLRVGLHVLRLLPRDFWSLTPAELMIMLGVHATTPAMGRARLEELARAYPDTPKGDENGTGGRGSGSGH